MPEDLKSAGPPGITFGVLGPVEIWAGETRLDPGTPRQRAIVAALAVDAGAAVPTDVLVRRVWGDEPPAGARRALQSYLARIRRLVAVGGNGDAPRVIRRGGGYLLDVDRRRVDAHRFTALVERARDPGCPEPERAALLADALDAWRGEPLMGVAGEWAERTREAWQRQYLGAVVAWAQVELNTGDPDVVIARLTGLVGRYPLVEPVTAALMRALAAAGRAAEALDCYTAITRRLVDDLGADPGTELREVHQALLRGSLDRAPAPRTGGASVPRRPVPAHLPPDVYGFTGRTAQLDALDELLARAADQPTAVVISALSGTAGVGKTALAVHWAHQVSKQFPDGQLYVNLRGFGPGSSPLPPDRAVRTFLEALGVPAGRIPVSLDAQVGLYRSELAGRRILIVLDNARDADQVRPLLPGTPTAFALITSRNQLTSLVAAEGAQPIGVDLLTPAEAHELLAHRLGADQVAAEPAAAAEIAARCAWLPLALAVAAAHAAAHPSFPLAALAARLRAASPLDTLTGGDPTTDVRVVFDRSYDALTPAAAALFRLLGLTGAAEVSAAAAASLAGLPLPVAQTRLAELATASLLTEPAPARYGLHDLLRGYAADRTAQLDGDADRSAAIGRLIDHYLHSADAAAWLLNPHRDPGELDPPLPGVTVAEFDGQPAALAWFSTERTALLDAVELAARHGFDDHTWRLGRCGTTCLDGPGHRHDALATQRTSLAAARRQGRQDAEARILRSIAIVLYRMGQLDESHQHSQQALALAVAVDDPLVQARCLGDRAVLLTASGRHEEALRAGQQALELYRAAGRPAGEAAALNSIGWSYAELGDNVAALAHCREALTIQEEIDDRLGAADTRSSIGFVLHQLGDHPAAITHYQRALEQYRKFGDRSLEAATLKRLGDTYQAAGDPTAARSTRRLALSILTDLDDADAVRAKLRDLDLDLADDDEQVAPPLGPR
ncbi:MAG TPA: tetratricopeptide repeat protein [Mycobacteriales bacterium]|nr:tetratricopeptide repeat protein [Mycobacteriales bacterium]